MSIYVSKKDKKTVQDIVLAPVWTGHPPDR